MGTLHSAAGFTHWKKKHCKVIFYILGKCCEGGISWCTYNQYYLTKSKYFQYAQKKKQWKKKNKRPSMIFNMQAFFIS